ncbi:MAG: DUF4124 domain-containing protein [Halioglobus sp.]
MLFATVASVGNTLNAATTHYRWYDDRGNPVHSDRPPPSGIDYEVVDTGSSLVRQVDGDVGAVPRESTPRVGNKFEKVETKPEPPKKNSELCARATENLVTLNNYARIRVKDDNGDLRYLNEEEIKAQKDEAQALIDINCE